MLDHWRQSVDGRRLDGSLTPEALALALGLFSAVTLAANYLSVKMGSDILVGRAILSVSSWSILIPAAIFVPMPDAATWASLALAVPAHFFYQTCLVNALKRGELSLVFPVMRGAAPLLTAFAALLLLGEALSAWSWAGLVVAALAVGSFALPPKGFALLRHPDRTALIWAAAAAIGTAIYNVTDARGVRIAPDRFTFIVWLMLLDPLLIVGAALILRRNGLGTAIARQWRYGVLAGMLSMLSYGSALYAFSLIETAKVSALRETSVVFAAIMGSLFLNESFGRRRLLAALMLAAGLVAIQFG